MALWPLWLKSYCHSERRKLVFGSHCCLVALRKTGGYWTQLFLEIGWFSFAAHSATSLSSERGSGADRYTAAALVSSKHIYQQQWRH